MSNPPVSVNLVPVTKSQLPVYSSTCDLRRFVKKFSDYLDNTGLSVDKTAARVKHLSVALPDDLSELLDIQLELDPTGSYPDIVERFLVNAGSPPPDPSDLQAEFTGAKLLPGETMTKFSGRLQRLAMAAFRDRPADMRETLLLNQFLSALKLSHPLTYRLVKAQHPTTVAEAAKFASEQVGLDTAIANHVSAPAASASLPASASSTATNLATASSSDSALAEILAHIRRVQVEPNRSGSPRARNYHPYPDQGRPRQNRNYYNNADYRPVRQQSSYRPGSVPPNLQCFNCGENHYARNCPKGQWPGQR